MTPRVSVLMPTFRQAAFICRALDSLCAQTMADWELLLVDDGSPDEARAAVRPYLADGRVRYHRLGANRGLGAAMPYSLLTWVVPAWGLCGRAERGR